MSNKISLKLLLVAVIGMSVIHTAPVQAADLVVAPVAGQPYGAHEIWAHNQMGQSFIAQASDVKAGFLISYDAVSAAMMAPNSPVTQMVVSLYDGEGLSGANVLKSTSVTVDTTQNGFLDVDFAASGVKLIPGNTYTLGLSSPDRGWTVPSVCVYPVGQQPTGAYTSGHPFFQGTIVLDETGICDNAFHVIDMVSPVVVTPTPIVSTPTPTLAVSKAKKVEGKGVITKVDASFIVVKNVTVLITSQTVIKLNYQPSLAVGQKVEYKGIKNTDGSVTAAQIEVKI